MHGLHPSHVTRISMDASSYDEICINCGATDEVPGGWGKLVLPCPKPVGEGGMTIEEYYEKERQREANIVIGTQPDATPEEILEFETRLEETHGSPSDPSFDSVQALRDWLS